MKKLMVLFVPGLVAVMYFSLFAQAPQGRGGQGAPAAGAVPSPAGAPGGQTPPVPGAPPAAGGRGGAPAAGAPAAGGPPRGGGGGGGPKNVQVLAAGADIPATMQGFVAALGLVEKGTCTYCHVEDRSSDEKRPKQVARRMVTMMRAINGTFPDGKPHVTCYTCHRGTTKPLMEPELPGLGQ